MKIVDIAQGTGVGSNLPQQEKSGKKPTNEERGKVILSEFFDQKKTECS